MTKSVRNTETVGPTGCRYGECNCLEYFGSVVVFKCWGVVFVLGVRGCSR